jgi:hypothetical protein
MQLTSEQFAAIVRALGRDQGRAKTDKRRAPRATQRASVEITVCSKEMLPQQRTHVLLANLSLRGLAVIAHVSLQRGQEFVLHLPQPADQWLDLLCTVIYSRSQPGGLHLIGAEFNCPVNQSQPTSQIDDQIQRIRQSILQ